MFDFKKRTAASAVALTAAVALLAACSGGGPGPAVNATGDYVKPAPDVTATLTISNWGDPNDQKIYDAVTERFNKEYPNVKVVNNFTPITTWSEYINKIVTQVAAGDPPDVINLATEGVQLGLHADLFASLDNYLEKDPEGAALLSDMDPSLVDGFRKDGSTYLIPNTWNTMLIYYNTKMFADAGIERPADDWTWDDFLAIAEKLTTGSGESKVHGFAVPYFNFGLTPWFYSNGTSEMSEDLSTPQLDDPAMVESATFVTDLINKYGVAPNPAGADPYQLFPAGKVAMTGAGHWVVGPFAEAGFSDYDVLPWPQKTEKASVYGAGGFAISKDSPVADIAWEYIKALTSETTQTAWASAGAAIPSTRSAANSAEFLSTPAHADLYYGALEYSKPVAAPSVYNTLEPTLMRAFDSILAGGDPEAELAKANKEVQDAIDNE